MTTPPPRVLDDALVLKYADLSAARATGGTRHIVRGELADDFQGLAIARYDSDPGYYLFYCDAAWNVVTDTFHDTVDAAIAQAEFEFDSVEFLDLP